jgi:Bifunctional DNA primase/polymerase, N-terminal
MSSKLKTLLAFAKRGVGILPLTPEDSAPAVARGAKTAITDPKTLRTFYKKRPKYNYGLALGDGIFAIRVKDNRAKLRLRELGPEYGERLAKQ